LVLFTEKVEANLSLDFGEFTPKTNITSNLLCRLSIDEENIRLLEIYLEDKFYRTDRIESISANRLKLKTKNQRVSLRSKKAIKVDLNDLPKDGLGSFILPLSFTALNTDLPGRYKARLIIKALDIKGRDYPTIIEREVEFKINPWLRITKVEGRDKVIIDRVKIDSKKIYSVGGASIKIASNVPWKLCANINPKLVEAKSLTNRSLKIQVMPNSDHYSIINNDGTFFKKNPTLIVIGTETVRGDGYWINMPFSMSIENFTKIKAGNISFPINFYLSFN
jgi:hypothetical protein